MVFLMTFPASEATAEPAPTLPVTDAPWTRRVVDDVDHVIALEDQVLEDAFWKSRLQHDAFELQGATLGVS